MSSARVVRCWVKSRNERNPYGQLLRKRTLARLPLTKRRKVGMTSNHHALYDLGYTRTTMALNKEKQDREVEQNSETTSQFGLQAATRLHEVGIASNRRSACCGEYVPGIRFPIPSRIRYLYYNTAKKKLQVFFQKNPQAATFFQKGRFRRRVSGAKYCDMWGRLCRVRRFNIIKQRLLLASPERGDSPRGGEMPEGQRGPLSTRGTADRQWRGSCEIFS